MSFIRPEIIAGLARWGEVIAAGVMAALGLWLALQPGYVLPSIGLILIALGLVWGALAFRRLRFLQAGEAPGIVRVTEAQIAYLGPRIGGFIGLPDLTEIRLLTLRGRRIWKLRPASGDVLHIPVEAQGADALFDAFAGLPGIDMGALLAALGAEGSGDSRVVALNSVDRLLWTRKGAGIVSRSEV
jgi:hypothetical protein